MDNVMRWIEENPWLAAVLGIGGLFILLWLFGFFSSGSSSSQGSGLAAAYYNAEAAQTTAGTNLQIATVQANRDSAMATTQANAAVAIAGIQGTTQTTLGQQTAGTTVQLSHDQLLATQNSNDDALAASNAAAGYAYQTALSHDAAMNYNTWLGSIIAPLAAKGGGIPTIVSGSGIAGYGTTVVNPPASPAGLEAVGYTPAGAAYALGLPYPGYTG